ncbi:hypothetical protein LLG95_13220 [bacterium]|nr:hypothetical protein [bacterium]
MNGPLGWGQVLLYYVVPVLVVLIIIFLACLFSYLSKILALLEVLNRKVDSIKRNNDA